MAIARSLNIISTDAGVDTDAGPRPTVLLKDDTDPRRMDAEAAEGVTFARAQRDEATAAVLNGRGPDVVQLRTMDEAVPRSEHPPVAVEPFEGSPDAAQLAQRGMPDEVLAQFDADTAATMRASIEDAHAQLSQAEVDRDVQRDAAVTTAEREQARVTHEADVAQREHVLTAREAIQVERQDAVNAQAAAVGPARNRCGECPERRRDGHRDTRT